MVVYKIKYFMKEELYMIMLKIFYENKNLCITVYKI